jgi:hypothetical protein
VIPPVVWIPAGFALGLALALYGGMSLAYDRGRRHQREELEADRAARAFRRLPRVPAHIPPLPMAAVAAAPELVSWAEHSRQALELTREPEPEPEQDDTSDFTRGMAAMVAEGMAAVDAYLEGWQP